MKVAIWGSYNYGNYGDDVMALMFAQHLQKLGVTPYVYRLNTKLAQQYNVKTVNSLEELIKGAKFCVLGGGTVLLEPLSGSIGSAMNEDTKQLLEVIQKAECPLFSISIGSDGTTIANRKLTRYQWKLLESKNFQGGTVRLKQDAELFQQLGKKVSLFPDVVLSLNQFWKTESKLATTEKLKVGFCIPDTPGTRKFADLLSIFAYLRRHAVFYFINTHLPEYNIKSGLLPSTNKPFIQHHYYEDPATMIKFLSSLDLLISNKLHPGITALGLGIPIYNLDKRAKTTSVLNSIDLNFVTYSLGKRFLVQLSRKLLSRKGILDTQNKFNFKSIEKYKEESKGHLDYLTELVERFR